MSILPAPNILGLPSNYVRWRQNQDEAVKRVIETDLPFITPIAPTGFGKSLVYVAAAHLSTNRTVILTSTKALMKQLERDFEEMGVVTVKGKNAYMCKRENDGSACDEGPCNAGAKCSFKDGGCPYYDAIRAAQTAPLVVTNYAFWMTFNKYARGLAKPDMLVCDEAHDLPQIVSDFLTCKISRKRDMIWAVIQEPTEPSIMTLEDWAEWADSQRDSIVTHINKLRKQIKQGAPKKIRRELRTFINLKKSLTMLSEADSQSWAMDVNDQYFEFAPTWPKGYTNDVLFLDIPKIMMTSATVSGKTTQLCGVDTQLNEVMEFPSTFPVKNRMLYHIPTVRLNIHATDLDIREWTRRIDQILRTRLDRKGIIHTTSYERRNHVLAQSKYHEYMMTHQTKDAILKVNQFKKAPPPMFMVSPSLTTGWDFPDDTCRLQILGKLPYPDTRNKIVKARCKEDQEYGAYIAAQGLEQACFSEDTEILTTLGWKSINRLGLTDKCYGVHTALYKGSTCHSSGFSPHIMENTIEKIHVIPYDGTLLRFKAKSLDALVTPDHDMLVITKSQHAKALRNSNKASPVLGIKYGIRKIKANNLPARCYLPLAGHLIQQHGKNARAFKNRKLSLTNVQYTKKLFYLMGIIISDGWFYSRGNAVGISQSKPEIVIKIKAVLDILSLHYTERVEKTKGTESIGGYKRNYDMHTFKISGISATRIKDLFQNGNFRRRYPEAKKWTAKYPDNPTKSIPLWVFKHRSARLKYLLAGLMHGDGSWSNGVKTGTYYTKDKDLADRFQMLATLLGYRSSLKYRKRSYEIQFTDISWVDLTTKENVGAANYSGDVWCVTTSLGSVVTRRNGKVLISGNCGRGVRSPTDWCENFIIDNNIQWFIKRHDTFLHKWFLQAYKSVVTIPNPKKIGG